MFLHHVAGEVGIAVIITLARLVAYAIDDGKRWRRFVFLIFLALAVAAGWWLLAVGGVHILLRDFSPATITRPAVAVRLDFLCDERSQRAQRRPGG